ncbi:TM0106 family RecB-like putative nuclease [Sphingomonas sp. RB1R13]|uniref:TM0106 family RecB-like putative nuclease n=1 Tax=Sphingomonas sp. RB1R13 TaxID=3096159 RepID=UPI002FCC03D5
MITAAELYAHVACPHRVHLDRFGDPSKRDEVNPFVQLLWDRGSSYEQQVIGDLGEGVVALRDLSPSERIDRTLAAMREGATLIYGGRITADDLLGEPDLLIRRDGHYIAADIKSGRGETGGDEDEDDGKLKPHYAVQVALYADVLNRLGFGAGHVAEIWDVKGRHVTYDLDRPRHTRTEETWWDFYLDALAKVRTTCDGAHVTRGALASICKLCHWHSHCRGEMIAAGDLSLIPQLGRAIRDGMVDEISCVADFAGCNPEGYVSGKKTIFPKLGIDRMRLFHQRARLLSDPDAKPFLREVVVLPSTETEVFFDIEADPMNDIVYLHGFVERHGGNPATDNFTAFFADGTSMEAEREAFAGAVNWLGDRPDAAVYFYSKYERTMYRKLCQKHPGVCDAGVIEALFTPPRSTDLYYDVVFRATEWPTYDHSIKTLAKYLGFAWRDTDPSGAASIEWYQRWLETGDDAIKQRILDYNEDDCRATAVVLAGIRALV